MPWLSQQIGSCGTERARIIVVSESRFGGIGELGVLLSCAMSTEKRVTVASTPAPRAETTGFLQRTPSAKVQFGCGPIDGACSVAEWRAASSAP